ncbi:hypothetical protein BGZ73_003516 [Actinomortierella ambigua]|nr:hypothetical protein BGZ73_003516 [Actinomortierella ambigua]
MRTVYDAFQHGLKVSSDKDCFGVRQYNQVTDTFGEYVWQSYVTVGQRRTHFGSGLLYLHQQLFPELDERARQQWTLAIWGPNRSEWTIAGLASDHLVSLIKNAERMPKLKIVISMDRLSSKSAPEGPTKGDLNDCDLLHAMAEEKGICLLEFDQVEQLGASSVREHTPPTPEDLFAISYTSGTTGLPKGAMITHANYVVFLATCEITFSMLKEDTVLSYLPLGHAFGRLIETIAFSVGARFGYGSGSPLRLLEDLHFLRPTYLPMVPRLLNRIYARVKAETVDAPGEVGDLARKGFEIKMAKYLAGYGVHHPEWDRILFDKVRQVLGGNVRLMLVASAPVSSEILAFSRVVFCCDIVEVYAQTESSGVATVTNVGDVTPGHVGPPAPGCEIKLVDVPELNYFTTDKPSPRGEICIRGPPVIQGYFKDVKKTRETIDEECFLHTGDIAVMHPNGSFTIIDRAKNIFKLSQGEYVAAEKIENKLLAKVPFVQQIFVHGDSHQSCLVAIVVPELETFLPLARQILNSELSTESPDVFRDACSHPKLRHAVQQMLVDAGRAAELKGFEIPKAIFIEPKPFTVENGCLTPTFKIKRHPVVQAYRTQLSAMYDDLQQRMSKL